MSGNGDDRAMGERAIGLVPSAPARQGLPRLFLWKRDVAAMLGVSLRTLERMISTGEIPAPDRRLRGRPAWMAATIYGWAAESPLTS